MSLALALALMASSTVTPSCSWDHPGVNPFMGDVVAAVDRYRDIPPDVRATLKARMAQHQYDDVVTIGRDRISGNSSYDYDRSLRDMHFGAGAVCTNVTRSKWSAKAEQRALVYCEKNQCIVVPTICRNVSRISRRNAGPGGGAVGGSGGSSNDVGASGGGPTEGAPDSPLSSGGNAAMPGNAPAHAGAPDTGNPGWTNSTAAGPGRGNGGNDWGPSSNPDVPYIGVPFSPGPPVVTPAEVIPVVPSTPVPEPATWMLLLAGLAIVGRIAARR